MEDKDSMYYLHCDESGYPLGIVDLSGGERGFIVGNYVINLKLSGEKRFITLYVDSSSPEDALSSSIGYINNKYGNNKKIEESVISRL